MYKEKVIIFTHDLKHYRVATLRIVAKSFNLTIGTSILTQLEKYKDEPFTLIYLPIVKIGPFIIHKKNIHRITSKFDVAIGLQNLRCLDILSLVFNPFLKTKIILWGIGVSASYTNKFDENKKFNFLRFFIYRRSDALIFYTDYPIIKYREKGFKENTLFVANNTIDVLKSEINDSEVIKDKILFIGSLYPEKGIDELLKAYQIAYSSVGNSLSKLLIIGNGSELKKIKKNIKENNLEEQIYLKGEIYDQNKIKKYFMSSLLCVSPKQAGLSVLLSMGYSVCFLTHEKAITGGEILNIRNGKTGLIYSNENDLSNYIIETFENPSKFIKIGENAKEFYDEFRTPSHMAKGIVDSINYVLNI
jgi:glycosyltransferase involved in cell wall biosynthesis